MMLGPTRAVAPYSRALTPYRGMPSLAAWWLRDGDPHGITVKVTAPSVTSTKQLMLSGHYGLDTTLSISFLSLGQNFRFKSRK